MLLLSGLKYFKTVLEASKSIKGTWNPWGDYNFPLPWAFSLNSLSYWAWMYNTRLPRKGSEIPIWTTCLWNMGKNPRGLYEDQSSQQESLSRTSHTHISSLSKKSGLWKSQRNSLGILQIAKVNIDSQSY